MTLLEKSNKQNRWTILTPNRLSLLRGIIGCILPFMLVSARPVWHIMAGVVFFFGAMTDYWDGLLARKMNQETDFGRIFDPTMDKILILIPMAIFVYFGYFSVWWIVPIFAREIIITFCRIAWIYEGKGIGAEKLGKWKFVFQLLMVAVAYIYLLSLDFRPLQFMGPYIKAALPLVLTLTVLMTIISGLTFMIRNRDLFDSKIFAKFTCALGVGLFPVASGTWGSLIGLFLIVLVKFNFLLYVSCFFALVWLGFWCSKKMRLEANSDPSFFVIDEACGMFVTFLFVPITILSLCWGFFLFRLFDVIKPFPVCRLEKIEGYWGILLDDIGAGIYAAILLNIFF